MAAGDSTDKTTYSITNVETSDVSSATTDKTIDSTTNDAMSSAVSAGLLDDMQEPGINLVK